LSRWKDRIGPITPNKVASLGLLFAGIATLASARLVEALDGGLWAGIALVQFALSFYVDAILPGGSKFSDEQIVFMRHYRIPYRPGGERIFSLVLGTMFLLPGAYLTIVNS